MRLFVSFPLAFTSAIFLSCATALAADAVVTDPPSVIEDSAQMPPTAKTAKSPFASSATITVASNYIYRGLSQTFGRPVVQGSLDFTHSSGLGAGVFASNINLGADASSPEQSEADGYVLWNHDFSELKTGVMVLSSNYINGSKFDYLEFSTFLGWKGFKLDLAYDPKYFGTDSNSTYVRLTDVETLFDKNNILASLGHTFFSDAQSVGFKSYSDFKVGLTHNFEAWSAEIDWTTTDRKKLESGSYSDQAVTILLSRTFE